MSSSLPEALQGPILLKPPSLGYVISHKYNPDLLLRMNGQGKLQLGQEQDLTSFLQPSQELPQSNGSDVYVEIKGYFQDAAEASKYLWVRKSLPPDAELVFVFESPSKAMHWLKVRKDGTKQTMAEWADKNQFRWFTEESFLRFVNELNSTPTPDS
ncbi:endonuclease [Pseudomonas phage UFV-P2]|uniref:Endonuclease n=1 Tax=Pseudomonas phage UFV-P2 TaxID=1235661 RepID=K0IGN2_9CAUD|nr:endonuclease [Pseudomonas phage UFV-P2]AFU62937.2 endonuclease [Pseudomonas phage UFV-P2]